MRPKANVPQFYLTWIRVAVLYCILLFVQNASTIICDGVRFAHCPAVATNLGFGLTFVPTCAIIVVCCSRPRRTENREDTDEEETEGWHASANDANVNLDTRPIRNIVVVPGWIIRFGKCYQRTQAKNAHYCHAVIATVSMRVRTVFVRNLLTRVKNMNMDLQSASREHDTDTNLFLPI